MGTVIRFPVEMRKSAKAVPARPGEEMGRVVILPVIRIERWTDTPPAGNARDQLGRLLADAVHVAGAPAGIDPHVASHHPSGLLQSLRERRHSRLSFRI